VAMIAKDSMTATAMPAGGTWALESDSLLANGWEGCCAGLPVAAGAGGTVVGLAELVVEMKVVSVGEDRVVEVEDVKDVVVSALLSELGLGVVLADSSLVMLSTVAEGVVCRADVETAVVTCVTAFGAEVVVLKLSTVGIPSTLLRLFTNVSNGSKRPLFSCAVFVASTPSVAGSRKDTLRLILRTSRKMVMAKILCRKWLCLYHMGCAYS